MAASHKKTSPEPLAILRGHGVPVNTSSFLSSTRLVSGGADGVVKIWDLRTRRESASSSSAHSKAGVLHASPLGSVGGATTRFVTQGRDGLVKVWDTVTFSEGCEPLASYYCGSFSFTKFATRRWPAADQEPQPGASGDAIANGDLVVCPGSEGSNVSHDIIYSVAMYRFILFTIACATVADSRLRLSRGLSDPVTPHHSPRHRERQQEGHVHVALSFRELWCRTRQRTADVHWRGLRKRCARSARPARWGQDRVRGADHKRRKPTCVLTVGAGPAVVVLTNVVCVCIMGSAGIRRDARRAVGDLRLVGRRPFPGQV